MLGQRGNCNRDAVGIAKAIAAFAAYVPIFRAGSSRPQEQAPVTRILPVMP
jgi:hypothetical protein